MAHAKNKSQFIKNRENLTLNKNDDKKLAKCESYSRTKGSVPVF